MRQRYDSCCVSPEKKKENGGMMHFWKLTGGNINMNEHLKLLVLSDVNAERYRQDKIHPEEKTVQDRFNVLVEEVGEVATALQNKDPQNLYEELIQVAESAVRMAEDVARKRGAGDE